MSSIYRDAQVFAKSAFSGDEEHQELRLKSVRLSKPERAILTNGVFSADQYKSKPSEAVYLLLNDLYRPPQKQCETCGKSFELRKFLSVREGYKEQPYCSASCRSRDPKFAERIANTNLERYGHTNNMWGSTRERTKNKWVEKYGVVNPMQNTAVQQKSIQTNLKNRGVPYPAQSAEVQQKCKQTLMKRYGIDSPFKNEKTKQTLMERYGTLNAMQNPEVFKNAQRYRQKTGVFPSGAEYKYQGFENIGVSTLIESGILEHQILIGDQTRLPSIEYWNPVKQKYCLYFPDIFIKSQNRLIEIKSSWTLKAQLQENLAKHEAAKKLGFRHEIWVCSSKKVTQIIL